VLTPEEKEVGTALVDIGGGTTDLAVFSGNNIKHTFVLSLGGNNMTNDISVGLRTPMAEAERIKLKYGTCLADRVGNDETIEISDLSGRGARKLPRQILAEILEPRVEEIFSLIKRELQQAGMKNAVSSGLVLTGGASMLEGISEIAESVFEQSVRIGTPQGISGLVDVVNNPMHATGVGLVMYGAKHQEKKKKFRIRDNNIFNRIMRRMRAWLKEVI
jgi:cell division protein FtsA